MSQRTGALIKVLAFFLMVCLLAALWLGAVLDSAGSFLGISVLSHQQWEQLSETCEESAFDPQILLWQGNPVPYDSHTDTLLLSQNMNHSQWEGSFSSSEEDVRIYFLEDPYMGDKQYCIWENVSFRIAIVKDGTWMQTNVLFSGVPVISLWGEADDSDAQFLLLDPNKQSGSGAVVSSLCRFHKRGSSSIVASDPSLRLSLVNEDGEKNNKNLLGIRDDDDWILNSFYTDHSRLRERIAYRLWEDINREETNPIKSSSVTYVELVWNNEYRGVYGLMPRLDMKQLSVKDGLLYKMRTWGYAGEQEFAQASGTDSLFDVSGELAATLEYPGENGSWEPLRAYYDYVMMDESQAWEDFRLSVGTSNAIAHSLYCTLLQANDNTWKNIYLAMYPEGNGGYTVYQSPWDMDMTFGIVFEGTDGDLTQPRPLSGGSLVYQKLHRDNPEQIQAMAREKWQSWKRGGITASYVCNMIDEEFSYLTRSGVVIRDKQRREYIDHWYLADQLKTWTRLQFQQMDAQFGK